MRWREGIGVLGELVVPHLCEACGARAGAHELVCAPCLAALPRREDPGARSATGLLILAPFRYEGEVARSLVRRFKYRGAVALAGLLAGAMAGAWRSAGLEGRSVVLVPVPAAPERRRLRGYDQALVLASALGERIEQPVAALARRRAGIASQTGLDPARRQRNIASAFETGGASAHRPLVIVDDVYTTGATVGSLARALASRGHRVLGAVAAFHTPAKPVHAPGERPATRFIGECEQHHVS